jgi:DnaJ-like protein
MAGRSKPRRRISSNYLVSWKDALGKTQTALLKGRDSSKSGIGFDSPVAIEPGMLVNIETEAHEPMDSGIVRYCVSRGTIFGIGVEFATEATLGGSKPAEVEDHYEILQISHRADMETIRRVYRIMASRFHPDNKETGDLDRFIKLKKAYEVLSDTESRAAYDASLQPQQEAAMPVFESRVFVDGIEGEMNRRLGVLSLLYQQRRLDEAHPGVSLLELEKRMSFPREYLNFTCWYLRSKGYVTVEDNSDFILTADGVDYIEEHTPTNVVLQRLMLSAGLPMTPPAGPDGTISDGIPASAGTK